MLTPNIGNPGNMEVINCLGKDGLRSLSALVQNVMVCKYNYLAFLGRLKINTKRVNLFWNALDIFRFSAVCSHYHEWSMWVIDYPPK